MVAEAACVMSALAAGGAAYAETALKPDVPVNVSRTAGPTEKARLVRLAYLDGASFRKVWLQTYADGPTGRQDVYARYSFDEAATWSAPVLLSRDAAQAPTGGQPIVVKGGLAFVADNDKPSVFAPPVTSGPRVLIAWNSAYCPLDAAAAGPYSNGLQGAGDFDGDGTPDRPFRCLWVASTTDPALATWDVRQLTSGERDVIGEVLSGNATGTAFAMAWQEDPAGLQPGEAEGRGDGGSGANVSGGTNIWYTHAPGPQGATLLANITQLSDNDVRGSGAPGASRPNLQVSGSTAVVAYEESACPGGSSGKCIVHHSFAWATPDIGSPGTIVSDVTRNSRRVRFVLQGAAAAGGSALRTVMLWRESVSLAPGAPADIVVRRGYADAAARPGSDGYRGADILADAPQNLTNVAASGGNANAHRAVLRGGFVGLAYDLTPDMTGADPKRTAVPTANYDLYFTRSIEEGRPGTWSAASNLTRLSSPALTVVEPRLVPTPATLVNPLTGVPDSGDAQDPDVLYVAYATESNTLEGAAGRVYVSRSTDRGATFERFVPVSSAAAGESEAQIRPAPDGSSATLLWMAEQVAGRADTKDAMQAVLRAVPLPDLRLAMPDASVPVGGLRTVAVTVHNHGDGAARGVVLEGELPAGLQPVGIAEPAACTIDAARFRCAIEQIGIGQSRTVSITVSSASEGSYVVTASVASEDLDADSADNLARSTISATPLPPPEPPPPEPPPPSLDQGGGCTMARAGAPPDPALPLLALVALAGLALRRVPVLSRRARAAACQSPCRARPRPAPGRTR